MGKQISSFLPLLLIGAAFYFLILRPQRSRARQAVDVRRSLTPGAEIMTTAGLFGRVAQVDDDTVLLEVAPGVTNRYLKAAVARIVTPVEPVGDADLELPGGGLPPDDRAS